MSQLSDNYSFSCQAHAAGINPNLSDKKIRIYMLGEHNERTLLQFNGKQTSGLAIAYERQDKEEIITPQYRDTIKTKFEIILPSQLEEIDVTHNGIIVDTMTKDELKEVYDSINHENPNLWKSAA